EPTLSGYRLGPASTFRVGSNPTAVALGDVTGDGRPDVVLTTEFNADPTNDDTLFVFPQTPAGTLGTPSRYPGSGGHSVVLADLDENGTLDVLVGQYAGISVLLAHGSGGLGPPVVAPGLDAYNLAAVDVDRDGHVDVVSLSWRNGFTIRFGDGHGGFRATQSLATNAFGFNDFEGEDLSGDGVADLAVTSGGGTPWELTGPQHDRAPSLLR